MLESLEYRIAKGRIESYELSTDAIVRQSQQAQDCMDCEIFLEKGIRACEAITLFGEIVRDAIVEGHLEPTPDVIEIPQTLYSGWRKQSERAQEWIAKHVENGYDITNLAEFRKCCEHVQDWLERKDWLDRASKTRQRFAEELW